MKNIYKESIEAVENGAKFHIDLGKRSLKINGEYIIKNGQYEGELGVEPNALPSVLYNIEVLYQTYKHSIPSERSQGKRQLYFRALPEYHLEDEDMLYGVRRDGAQISLELYVLCSILNGSLVWNESLMGKWFWQSQLDKDLIILKDWIVSNK